MDIVETLLMVAGLAVLILIAFGLVAFSVSGGNMRQARVRPTKKPAGIGAQAPAQGAGRRHTEGRR